MRKLFALLLGLLFIATFTATTNVAKAMNSQLNLQIEPFYCSVDNTNAGVQVQYSLSPSNCKRIIDNHDDAKQEVNDFVNKSNQTEPQPRSSNTAITKNQNSNYIEPLSEVGKVSSIAGAVKEYKEVITITLLFMVIVSGIIIFTKT